MTALNIATESVFLRDASGRLQPKAGSSGDVQWQEVASCFDTIRLIARVENVGSLDAARALDSGLVRIIPLPRYRGIGGMIRALPRLLRALVAASRMDGAFLVRLPGPIGTFLALVLAARRRPYAVQLVGDPYEVLRVGDFGLPGRSLRFLAAWLTRRAIGSAQVVNYVTAAILQRRYPPNARAECYAVSDVALPDDWFSAPRIHGLRDHPRLFFCGSLAQRYKGLDILIEAMALRHARGMRAEATIAGDGIHRGAMQDLAGARNLQDWTTFVGAVPADAVRGHIDNADLFVMPSRTEGLPRSLVEAMARGLPAIGAKVGGIVELLPPARLIAAEDHCGLADAIERLWLDPEDYRAESQRGFLLAQAYSERSLSQARARFYASVGRLGSGRRAQPDGMP